MRPKGRRNRIILAILSLVIVISMGLSMVLTLTPPKHIAPTPIFITPLLPTRTPTPDLA